MSGRLVTTYLALLLLLAPVGAICDDRVHVGGQLNWADDADFGVGGRVMVGLPTYPGLELLGSFDLFFPDGDVDYWEINGNAVYNFPIPEGLSVRPYTGGGLNIAHIDAGGRGFGRGEDTDLGLNLLGGVKFPLDNFTPFAEARVELGGGEQFVLTGGFLFP